MEFFFFQRVRYILLCWNSTHSSIACFNSKLGFSLTSILSTNQSLSVQTNHPNYYINCKSHTIIPNLPLTQEPNFDHYPSNFLPT